MLQLQRHGAFLIHVTFFSLPQSPAASSPEPGDIPAGTASHDPAAGADCTGPAGVDTDSQWHTADPCTSHSADSCCTPGAAGPGR